MLLYRWVANYLVLIPYWDKYHYPGRQVIPVPGHIDKMFLVRLVDHAFSVKTVPIEKHTAQYMENTFRYSRRILFMVRKQLQMVEEEVGRPFEVAGVEKRHKQVVVLVQRADFPKPIVKRKEEKDNEPTVRKA